MVDDIDVEVAARALSPAVLRPVHDPRAAQGQGAAGLEVHVDEDVLRERGSIRHDVWQPGVSPPHLLALRVGQSRAITGAECEGEG